MLCEAYAIKSGNITVRYIDLQLIMSSIALVNSICDVSILNLDRYDREDDRLSYEVRKS